MLPSDKAIPEEILRRIGCSGVASSADLNEAASHAGDLPYLSASNERLMALKRLYERIESDALVHTQWSQEYVAREISLQRFRGESGYMWQSRDLNFPVHYLCTYYYLKSTAARDLLERCIEDDSFGVQSVFLGGEHITRDRLDSVSELSFLRQQLAAYRMKGLSVLDIGCGYGRFAHRLVQCFPDARAICTDAIAESIFLSEFYLRFRQVGAKAAVVDLATVESALAAAKVDVAVAINSLSECSGVAIRWWLDLIARFEIPFLFLVSHAAFGEGREIYSCEAPGRPRSDVAALLAERGYRRVTLQPKYAEPNIQRYGVSPTYYHLFARC